MAMKFHGELDELRLLLDRHDVVGSWDAEPNGVHMMRRHDGSNLHWSSTRKTLWFSGKPAVAARLADDVAGILHLLAAE